MRTCLCTFALYTYKLWQQACLNFNYKHTHTHTHTHPPTHAHTHTHTHTHTHLHTQTHTHVYTNLWRRPSFGDRQYASFRRQRFLQHLLAGSVSFQFALVFVCVCVRACVCVSHLAGAVCTRAHAACVFACAITAHCVLSCPPQPLPHPPPRNLLSRSFALSSDYPSPPRIRRMHHREYRGRVALRGGRKALGALGGARVHGA